MPRFLLIFATLLALNAGQIASANRIARPSKSAKAWVGKKRAAIWHSFGVQTGRQVIGKNRLGRLLPTTIRSTRIGRKLLESGVVVLSGKRGANLYKALAKVFGGRGSEFVIYEHTTLFLEAFKKAETVEEKKFFKEVLFSIGNKIESKPLVVFASDPTRSDLERVHTSHQEFKARQENNEQLVAALQVHGIAVLSRVETRRIRKSLKELEIESLSGEPVQDIQALEQRIVAAGRDTALGETAKKNLVVLANAIQKARKKGAKKLAVFDGDLRRESLNTWAVGHYGKLLRTRGTRVIDGVRGGQLLSLLARLDIGNGGDALLLEPKDARQKVLAAFKEKRRLGLIEAEMITPLSNALERAIRNSAKTIALFANEATASDLVRVAKQR